MTGCGAGQRREMEVEITADGLLNAIVMPYVLQANRSAIEPKIIELARYLDL